MCMRWALIAGFFSEGLGLDQFGATPRSQANRAAHKFPFLPGSALMWLSSPSPTLPACNAYCKPIRVKLHTWVMSRNILSKPWSPEVLPNCGSTLVRYKWLYTQYILSVCKINMGISSSLRLLVHHPLQTLFSHCHERVRQHTVMSEANRGWRIFTFTARQFPFFHYGFSSNPWNSHFSC